MKINYPKLGDIYDFVGLPTEADPFELITLRRDFSPSSGYKSEENSRDAPWFPRFSEHRPSWGLCPVVLPVSGSVGNFYTTEGPEGDDSTESEKSVERKRGAHTKRENESVRVETVIVEIGRGREKPVIRRHIRLDEPRITTCHLSPGRT